MDIKINLFYMLTEMTWKIDEKIPFTIYQLKI